jgi:quercetin dioxygenase-like cupin family protein
MELSERCIAQLEKEGWANIYEWQDKPGTVYPEHSHEGAVVLMVTEGSIDFTINGVTHKLRTGDRFDVPPHAPHTAVVGPDGVQFVVAEEIEGDS